MHRRQVKCQIPASSALLLLYLKIYLLRCRYLDINIIYQLPTSQVLKDLAHPSFLSFQSKTYVPWHSSSNPLYPMLYTDVQNILYSYNIIYLRGEGCYHIDIEVRERERGGGGIREQELSVFESPLPPSHALSLLFALKYLPIFKIFCWDTMENSMQERGGWNTWVFWFWKKSSKTWRKFYHRGF